MAAVPAVVVVEGTKIAVDSIKALKEYAIERQREATERERIRSVLEVCLTELQVKANLMKKVLEDGREERALLYDMLGKALPVAIERGDVVMFENVTKALLAVYDKAPTLADVQISVSKGKKRLS